MPWSGTKGLSAAVLLRKQHPSPWSDPSTRTAPFDCDLYGEYRSALEYEALLYSPPSISGSRAFQEKTKKHSVVKDSHEQTAASIKAKPIPGNAGATFFATLEYEAKLRAGVSLADEDEEDGKGNVRVTRMQSSGSESSTKQPQPPAAPAPFRSARGTVSDPVVLLHMKGKEKHADRLLAGYQRRLAELGVPRKPNDLAKEFHTLTHGEWRGGARPQTPRVVKEQWRRVSLKTETKRLDKEHETVRVTPRLLGQFACLLFPALSSFLALII